MNRRDFARRIGGVAAAITGAWASIRSSKPRLYGMTFEVMDTQLEDDLMPYEKWHEMAEQQRQALLHAWRGKQVQLHKVGMQLWRDDARGSHYVTANARVWDR